MTHETMLQFTKDGKSFYTLREEYLNCVGDRSSINTDECLEFISKMYHSFKDNKEDIYNDSPLESNSWDDLSILKEYHSFLYAVNTAICNATLRFDPSSKLRKFMHSDLRDKYTKIFCEEMIDKCEYINDIIREHVNRMLEIMNPDISSELMAVTSRHLFTLNESVNKLKFVYNYL